jgi:homoserine dehydrogenase
MPDAGRAHPPWSGHGHTLPRTQPGGVDGSHCEERAAVGTDATAGYGIRQARRRSGSGSLRRRRALSRVSTYNLAFVGFGNVGRALAALLESRRVALGERFGIDYRVTGVASRRLGWWADERGLDPTAPAGARCPDLRAWLARSRPDVVFEATPLDPHTGQPALDYLRESLAAGAHAISANKGPVVHGYRELARVAAAAGRHYLFEAAVMDGAPVFSLVRHCLPLAGLRGVRGVFTSTATVVLEALERGATVADGVAEAQRLGVAESDPSYDVDGWDSAVKLCALAAVLFDAPLVPGAVPRVGIADLDPGAVRRARADGAPYRLVGRLRRDSPGSVEARVAPERVPATDPLGAVRGTDLVLCYEADVFPGGLTVASGSPGITTTAYGLFTDFLTAVGAVNGGPRL